MKLEVIVNKKRGVINITSEQFIIEDLKSHVCKKLELSESGFKVKINLGECPSMELVKQLSTFDRVEVFNRFDNHKKLLESILSERLNAKINIVGGDKNSFLIVHKSGKRIASIKRGEGSYYHAKANTPKNELDVIKNLFRLNTLLKYEDNKIKKEEEETMKVYVRIISDSFTKPQKVLYYDGRKAFLYCAVAFVRKQGNKDFLAWVPKQVNPFDESGRLKMQGGKDLQYHVENYFIDPTLDNFVDYVHEQKKYDVGSEHHKKWVEV